MAIGYEVHESRGKTDNSRRPIDLDATTITVLRGWRALQAAEYDAGGIEDPGWVFADAEGTGSTLTPCRRRSSGSPAALVCP